MRVHKIGQRLKQLNTPFVRNLGWLGGARLFNRVTRLAATVVLARCLSPHDYGLAAIVLTSNELVRVFTRNGIGTRLIQGSEAELPRLCQSAFWLNWAIFIGLWVFQCLAAFPIARFYDDSQIILPICAIAFNLLFLPLGMVQAALIQREGRLKVIALSDALQVTTENLSSLGLALMGLGMWAIVLPRLVVAPIWVLIMVRSHPWRPHWRLTTARWPELLKFGRNILGVELLHTLRANLDYLIVGRFLGVDALGVYYFAFNAGLGLSLGLINSVKAALLPQLCQTRTQLSQFRATYFGSLKAIACTFVPLVLLQAVLAPIYVPLVFSARWTPAIPIVVLVCLSAIPRPFANAASQLLIAVDRPDLDLAWNVLFTGLFAMGLFMSVQGQSLGVALSVLIIHSLCLPAFTLWATRYVFRRLSLATSTATLAEA